MQTGHSPLFSNRQLAKILLPLILQSLLTVTIGMVDSIMVSSEGEAAFAGVSLVNSLDTLLVTLFTALATGGTVVLAQMMGREDRLLACETAKQLCYTITALSSVMTLLVLLLRAPLLSLLFGEVEESVMQNAMDYFIFIALSLPFFALDSGVGAIFRAQGDSMITLKISLLKNALNIVGNALFIYVLRMGAMGAAISTMLSRVIGAVIMTVIAHHQKRYIYIEHLFHYRPKPSIIRAILHIGIPNGVENSLFQFGRLITSSLVSTLGTASIAANAAALSLANLQYTMGGAVHNTSLAVIGRCIGAEEQEQAKQYTRRLLGIEYLLVLTVSAIICLFSSPLLGLYHLSGESFGCARSLLFYHSAASILIWPVAFGLPSSFRAANDINFTMVVSICSMWIFRVALAYGLAQSTVSIFGLWSIRGMGLGIMGVWIAMTVDWVFRAVLFLWRYLSGKWLTKYKKQA
ncbi:MAG: MATE family efflux transporter [Clostridia bacterium]|nr:MATE family efflux transporter [Clostridia bacterium]